MDVLNSALEFSSEQVGIPKNLGSRHMICFSPKMLGGSHHSVLEHLSSLLWLLMLFCLMRCLVLLCAPVLGAASCRGAG